MRLYLPVFLFLSFSTFVVNANAIPIPNKKPLVSINNSHLEDKIISKLEIPRPPLTPQHKKPNKNTVESKKNDQDFFRPSRKPIHIQTIISSVAKERHQNQNDTDEHDSFGKVTLLFKKPSNIPNEPSKNEIRWADRELSSRSSRLKETNVKSPFKTARVQNIKGKKLSDPIIIFFQENTNTLEVGQIDILKIDVLKPLQRNANARAVIKWFAEKNTKNPDETRKLSLARAMLIQKHLVEKNIRSSRLKVKVMEDKTPISPKDRVDIFIEY
jgi:hypothetical protein